jgi:hypothetical protein
MASEAVDPIELYSTVNPISPERLDALIDGPGRDSTFARVIARREALSVNSRELPKRRLLAAVAMVAALAIPALAFGGFLGSLFRVSTHGTPVRQGGLSRVSGFDLSGATRHSLVELAARDGVGIYAAKTRSGNQCYFVGPADRSKLATEGLSGGCRNASASKAFPSASQPVVDTSLFALAPGAAGPSVQRLAGVAADGVISVQVLALDCHVVATAPVTDNVYVTDDLPMTPEAQIVARDANGNPVWHEAVTPPLNPNANSCGLR